MHIDSPAPCGRPDARQALAVGLELGAEPEPHPELCDVLRARQVRVLPRVRQQRHRDAGLAAGRPLVRARDGVVRTGEHEAGRAVGRCAGRTRRVGHQRVPRCVERRAAGRDVPLLLDESELAQGGVLDARERGVVRVLRGDVFGMPVVVVMQRVQGVLRVPVYLRVRGAARHCVWDVRHAIRAGFAIAVLEALRGASPLAPHVHPPGSEEGETQAKERDQSEQDIDAYRQVFAGR